VGPRTSTPDPPSGAARRHWTIVLGVVTVCLLAAAVLTTRQVTAEHDAVRKPVSAARLARIRDSAARAVAAAAPGTPGAGSPGAGSKAASTAGLTIRGTRTRVAMRSRNVTIDVGGLTRSYLLYSPARDPYGRTLPVLVELSGSAVSNAMEAARADFQQITGPAVVVYPQDYQLNWDAGACCGVAAAKQINDVAFVAAVISQVEDTVPHASKGPVYLAGYSNGGKMALRVACADPSLVAAVAVYGAVESLDCAGPPAASLLELAGTADPELTVGPSGTPTEQNGFTEPTVTAEVESYLAADHCSAASRSVTVGSVSETRWSDCPDGRQDGLVLFSGQTHTWPETTATTPSAQQVMWDYFVSLGA
jgi:polyhydroxybutyrate depolymerase